MPAKIIKNILQTTQLSYYLAQVMLLNNNILICTTSNTMNTGITSTITITGTIITG